MGALIKIFAEDIHCLPVNSPTVYADDADYYATNMRCSLKTGGTNLYRATFASQATAFWVQFWAKVSGTAGSNTTLMYFGKDGTNYPFALMLTGNTGNLYLGVWNNSAYANVAESATAYTAALTKYRIKVTPGQTGRFECWQGAKKILDYSGDLRGGTMAATAIVEVKMGSLNNTGNYVHFSSGIVHADDPDAMTLAPLAPSAAGTNSDWTGDYTDINEVPNESTAVISSATVDQVSTFGLANLPAGTSSVLAVVVSAYAVCGLTGPQNIRLAMVSDGDAYFSGDDIALATSYGLVETAWATDPATDAAWERTAVNALEAGVKSLT